MSGWLVAGHVEKVRRCQGWACQGRAGVGKDRRNRGRLGRWWGRMVGQACSVVGLVRRIERGPDGDELGQSEMDRVGRSDWARNGSGGEVRLGWSGAATGKSNCNGTVGEGKSKWCGGDWLEKSKWRGWVGNGTTGERPGKSGSVTARVRPVGRVGRRNGMSGPVGTECGQAPVRSVGQDGAR